MTRITIEVVEADALALDADVLVLKHAQSLYGADAKAVERSGVRVASLPPAGAYHWIREPDGIRANALLFVGVVSLWEFDYAAVRDFGRRALSSVASECPDARVVALTLHGVGFGLDELEAFDSEVAGLLDAIQRRDVPRTLERVVIAELNPGRAQRMGDRLRDALPLGGEVSVGRPLSDAVEREAAERFGSVGTASAEREHAFIAMPFSSDFEDLFHYGITSAVRSVGLLCERIDQQAFTGEVLARMKQQVETARIVVADLSGSNPNVFLEVGYAWGHNVDTVLLTREGSDLKFDIQGQKLLMYSGIKDAEVKLTAELRALVR